MSLIYCPECGHEISNSAVACPQCGRPIHAAPTIERKVVVTDVPRKEAAFPPWAFVPLGILGVVLLFILFYAMSRTDESANTNLKVDVAGRRPATDTVRTETQTIPVPPATDTQTITVPGSQTTTVPGSQTGVSNPPSAAVSKGSFVIDAKITSRTGSPQPVKRERFYLLDKDLESILSEADLDPIEGQSLMNSLGLSVLYPDRYGDFNRAAMWAIKNHIKYAGQTDTAGKAQLGGIEPDSYYLFGVTKTGRGFAVWSSPVTILAGEDILNLSPQRLTEIEDSSG